MSWLLIFFIMDQSNNNDPFSSSDQQSAQQQIQTRSLREVHTQNQNQSVLSPIKIKLPDYQRYSKVYPIHLRDFTKYDSLVNQCDKQIEVSPIFAWLILLLNMFSTAMVPCWLMSNFKYQGMTQNSWRFLTISILTLPFVAYQKRQIAAVGGNIFKLINSQMIKKNFMSSISVCIWFLIVKYAVKLTSMIHTFNLMSLQSMVIVLNKRVRKQNHHQFESAGIILIFTGLVCTFYDSIDGEIVSGRSNQLYLSYSNLSRICGDCLSILGSVISVYFSQRYQAPTEPRFLNVFILNFFIGFNFIWFGYFFGGSELSFDEYYGAFGVLSKQNFPSIFYIGIMLGFNLMISNILINQIFSKVIIKIGNCFIILIMGLFLHILDIQLASGITSLSFGFIVPGLILIMSGQHLLENNQIQMNFVIYQPLQHPNTFNDQIQLQQMNLMEQRKVGFNQVERRSVHSL